MHILTHTFVSPSAVSRRAVVSYWQKYVHEVLVNCLGGLSLPRKSVGRLTDHPDITVTVYRGRKTIQQQNYAYLNIYYCLVSETADNVNTSSIKVDMKNNKTGAVHIHWDDPPNPNGLIVTYEIEYSKSNIQNVS